MRIIAFPIIAIGAAALGWFAYPDIATSIGLIKPKQPTSEKASDTAAAESKKPAMEKPKAASESPKVASNDAPAPTGDSTLPSMSLNSKKVELPSMKDTTLSVGADTTIRATAAAPSNAPDESSFPSIETKTSNWTFIPPEFLRTPKLIKVKKAVSISNGTVTTKLSAGAECYALAADGMKITVAPSPTSPIKGEVAMEDTNLKLVLTEIYEEYKQNQIAAVKAKEVAERNAANAKILAEQAAKEKSRLELGPKPVKDSTGKYEVLLASMKEKKVTEITPANVKTWGEVVQTEIKGDAVYTIEVTFDTNSIVGKIEDVKAIAIVKAGKVKRWQYVGSGEEVP